MKSRMNPTIPVAEGPRSARAADQTWQLRRGILSVLERVHHELRTPITKVLGLTEAMLASPLSDEQTEWMSEIRASAKVLSDRLMEILSLLEMEAGRAKSESMPFSLSKVLETAYRMATPQLTDGGNRVDIGKDPDVPDFLDGAASQLDRTLVHVVAYLSRQVQGETIRLRVRLSERTEESVLILFELGTESAVRDPREDFKDASIDLVFARALVDAMGGELHEPDPNGPGIHLRFSLSFGLQDPGVIPSPDSGGPCKGKSVPGEGPSSEPPPGGGHRHLRILLAEDNLVIQRLTQKLLEVRGHQVYAVPNGRDAVEAVRERVFDVVLMDLEMPEMDGISATREIRSAARGAGPPILAYTAHVLAEVRARCKVAGMDGFLAKPVSSDDLVREVERWPRRSDG